MYYDALNIKGLNVMLKAHMLTIDFSYNHMYAFVAIIILYNVILTDCMHVHE